jgi:hypothetical protein
MSLRRRTLYGFGYAAGAFAAWWIVIVTYFFTADYVAIPRGIRLPIEPNGLYGWAALSGIVVFPISAFVLAILGRLPGTRNRVRRGFSVDVATFPEDVPKP